MKAEATIKTTVTVDLGDFTTADLIDELESRGHAIDADCASELDTQDLLEELNRRQSDEFARVPLDELIKALVKFDCPTHLVQGLRVWENQPIPTKAKLDKWLSQCGI